MTRFTGLVRLTEEILFGKLETGGTVRISLADGDDPLKFAFEPSNKTSQTANAVADPETVG